MTPQSFGASFFVETPDRRPVAYAMMAHQRVIPELHNYLKIGKCIYRQITSIASNGSGSNIQIAGSDAVNGYEVVQRERDRGASLRWNLQNWKVVSKALV